MNRILRTITEEMYNTDTDEFLKIVGNYAVYRDSIKNFNIVHYYYGKLICKVDLRKKIFFLRHCGYKPSTLTTAQLNYLEHFYTKKGFKLKYRGY